MNTEPSIIKYCRAPKGNGKCSQTTSSKWRDARTNDVAGSLFSGFRESGDYLVCNACYQSQRRNLLLVKCDIPECGNSVVVKRFKANTIEPDIECTKFRLIPNHLKTLTDRRARFICDTCRCKVIRSGAFTEKLPETGGNASPVQAQELKSTPEHSPPARTPDFVTHGEQILRAFSSGEFQLPHPPDVSYLIVINDGV